MTISFASDHQPWTGFRGSGHRGTYDNGLFGFYSVSQHFGAFIATRQFTRTRGILVVDDVVITTNDPKAPATIQTSLNFHVSGATSHYNRADPADYDRIEAELDMTITINGTVFTGEYSWLQGPSSTTTTVTGLGTQIAGGGFAETFSATITTALATVPVGTPFTLRLEFTLSASSGGRGTGYYAGMTFNAENTAGFLPGATIFNDLPPGYVVNSGTGIIVDNATFLPPEVPAASTWGLIVSGMTLLAAGSVLLIRRRDRAV